MDNIAPAEPARQPQHAYPLLVAGRACNSAIGELADDPYWVCWRRIRHNCRWVRKPFTPAGSPASVTDPCSYSSFDECWIAAFVHGHHSGIGRVLTGDGLVGIDLDNAIALDGSVEPWALKIVSRVPSYWERSPSGTGLHSWCRGIWPTAGNRNGTVEVYARRRYLTVTGDHLADTPEHITACDLEFLTEYFSEINGGYRDPPRQLLPCTFPAADPMPAHLVDGLARTHPQLRRILQSSYHSESERHVALVRFAKRAGWSPEAAWSLVLGVRSDAKTNRSDYAARTLRLVGYSS